MRKRNGNKIGPGIMLSVMSGDAVNIRATSWYQLNGASPGTPVNPLNDLVVAMSRGISAVATDYGKITITELQSNGVLTPGIGSLLSQQDASYTEDTRPKAYLNWILLDEQFKLVSSSSGFEQVGDDNELKTWVKTGLPINRNGYLYVYTSNESPVDVFFDNLQVTHVRGPLQEETHYYPFGLTMAGISSKAAGKLENKKNKFQGQEYNDDLGVDLYEFKYRMDDPQTGRFWQVDPLSDKYVYNSTYAFSENKVTGHVELEGLEAVSVGTYLGIAWDMFKSRVLGARDATYRVATGTSGKEQSANVPAPAKSTVEKSATLGDIGKATTPYTDVLQITQAAGSLIPVGEAGAAGTAISSLSKAGSALNSAVNIEDAVWAQKTFSGTFSKGGTFAGQTVSDVATSLSNGGLTAADVPINVIVRDGQTMILNTRSSAALTEAGIPRSEWNVVNQTGNKTFENMLTDQLKRNALPNGTNTIRQSGTQKVLTNQPQQ